MWEFLTFASAVCEEWNKLGDGIVSIVPSDSEWF